MKLTKEYILECLDKHCTFEGLTEDNFADLVVAPLQDAHCFNNWTWDNGVTKGVLIFSELDFVVKIPFEGRSYWTDSHYVDENGSWVNSWQSNWRSDMERIESEEEFQEFDGSSAQDSNWDYCAAEAEIAESARNEGLIRCLAATDYLGKANGHPIYIQEKCFMFCDARTSTNQEKYKNRTKADYDSLKEVRERADFWGIDNDWVLDFLIYWGEEMLKRLGQFLFDHNVEDLHNGNIGYRNGVPCLVDYSSYRE